MVRRRVLGCAAVLAGLIGVVVRPASVPRLPQHGGVRQYPAASRLQEKTEWVQARLMYPQHPNARFSRYSRFYGGLPDWREGGTSWTQDYPRADRHFASALCGA